MFGRQTNPIAAYSSVNVETSVQSADPHKLVLLLFEGAQAALKTAEHAFLVGDTAIRGEAISKAINIINNGLRASLDVERGGEIGDRLAALYEYMCTRLLQANLRSNAIALKEVAELLEEVHSAWRDIEQNNPQGT